MSHDKRHELAKLCGSKMIAELSVMQLSRRIAFLKVRNRKDAQKPRNTARMEAYNVALRYRKAHGED